MREIIKQTLKLYDMTDDVVLAAVSGGRDSMALLHVLHSLSAELGYRLYAVHVNHGLREAAIREQILVQEYAKALGVPLQTIALSVEEQCQKGESVEMAARRLRYEAFLQALRSLPQTAVLATAHHQRDQAETVLMHLLRGSGTRGLCGIHPVRRPYVRPMLFVPHADIERYIREHDIPYLEDESNADTSFVRNRIRHTLLPQLREEYNPNIERALGVTAMAAREDEIYLRSQAELQKEPIDYRRIPNLAVLMQGKAFVQIPIPLQKRLLRMAMEELGVFDMEEGALSRSLAVAREGGTVQLRGDIFVKGGHTLQVYREALPDDSVLSLTPQGCRLGPFTISMEETDAQAEKHDAWSAYLSRESACCGLHVRTRRKGDRVAYGYGHKKLSRAMKDDCIPPSVRDHLPVVLCGEEVVWAPMIQTASKFRPKKHEKRILKIQVTVYAYDGGVEHE